MSELVRSVVECNSCDYSRPWREGWPWRFRSAQLRWHKRRTGHDTLVIHQEWRG